MERAAGLLTPTRGTRGRPAISAGGKPQRRAAHTRRSMPRFVHGLDGGRYRIASQRSRKNLRKTVSTIKHAIPAATGMMADQGGPGR